MVVPSPPVVKSKMANSVLFWASMFLTLGTLVTGWILAMLALYRSDYFIVDNTSPDPEIYSIFRQIVFDLYGHCILINKTWTCRKAGADSIFTGFYNFENALPKVGTPQQFVDSLAAFRGHNPYVFYPLFFATIGGILSIIAVCVAAKVKTKKSIIWVGGSVMVTFLLIAISLGLSVKIYDDMLPDLLNNPMSVTVVRNNRTVNLVGTPAMLGIKSKTSDGIPIIASSLIVLVGSLILSVRWWFEGTVMSGVSGSGRYVL